MRTLFFFISIFSVLQINAQTMSQAEINTVVENVGGYLDGYYPFPEISARYTAMLKNNTPKYLKIDDRQLLAKQLNDDLKKVHHDVHLSISVVPEGTGTSSPLQEDALKNTNYGFKTVELDNINSTAYISIPHGFNCTQEGFEMAGHAMNMAAYSKYVIIDLRGNGGGAGGMGHFLASYFFEPGEEKFYLDAFEKTKKNLQEYTYGYVPGKRLTHTRLFILIDKNTASASEGFAFAMQKLKRATIIGEPSAGAGIAGTFVQLSDNFQIFLPLKMIVAPNTNDGWEGTGVIPDVIVKENDAMLTLKKIILEEELQDPKITPEKKEIISWKTENLDYESLKTKANPLSENKKYKEICRIYNNREAVEFNNGKLYWVISEKEKVPEKYEMFLLKKDVYLILKLNENYGINSSRLYINRNSENKIINLTRKTLISSEHIYTRKVDTIQKKIKS